MLIKIKIIIYVTLLLFKSKLKLYVGLCSKRYTNQLDLMYVLFLFLGCFWLLKLVLKFELVDPSILIIPLHHSVRHWYEYISLLLVYGSELGTDL